MCAELTRNNMVCVGQRPGGDFVFEMYAGMEETSSEAKTSRGGAEFRRGSEIWSHRGCCTLDWKNLS